MPNLLTKCDGIERPANRLNKPSQMRLKPRLLSALSCGSMARVVGELGPRWGWVLAALPLSFSVLAVLHDL